MKVFIPFVYPGCLPFTIECLDILEFTNPHVVIALATVLVKEGLCALVAFAIGEGCVIT